MATSVPALTPEVVAPPQDFTRTILDVIRDALDERQWSLYKLIKVGGLDMTRAYRWFRCGYSPTLDELVLIAAALDMSLVSLIAEAKHRYDEAAR